MITTIYKIRKAPTRGPRKGKVWEEELFYRTKSLTPMHDRIHEDSRVLIATTYEGGRFYSHFCPGVPCPMVLKPVRTVRKTGPETP